MASSKHQITAEWSVEAKLTLTHPNFGSKDENGNDESFPSEKSSEPVKVVYKFSTEDDDSKIKTDSNNMTFKKGNILFSSTIPTMAQVSI